MSAIGEAKAKLIDSIEAVARLPSFIAGQPPNDADEMMVYAVLKQYQRNADQFLDEFMRIAGPFMTKSRKWDRQMA